MNAWSDIVRILTEDAGVRELLLVPNARLMRRDAGDGGIPASEAVFSASDVLETLQMATTHSARRQSESLGNSGVLSIGLRGVGRIRLTYFTQRGSRAFRIQRIPFEAPAADDLCAEPAVVRELAECLCREQPHLFVVHGRDMLAGNHLAYALLGHVNATRTRLIYIAEQSLSFLLTHDRSLVMQVEVPTDVPTMDQAVRDALLLEPDIVLLGGVALNQELPMLPQLVTGEASVAISTGSDEPLALFARCPTSMHRRLAADGTGRVLRPHFDADGKLRVDVANWPADGL